MEFGIIAWLICAIGAGAIASSKGRSGFGYFMLGLLIPFIGLLISIGMAPRQGSAGAEQRGPKDFVLCWSCNKPRRMDAVQCKHCGAGSPDPHAGQKKCPACAEWIQREARKCKHCGEALVEPAAAPAAEATAPDMGYCPGCGKLRAENVPKCLYCGDTAAVVDKRPPQFASLFR